MRLTLPPTFTFPVMFCVAVQCSHAQTGGQPVRVQLPIWHVFGVSTTVLVPDRGTLVLGGVNRGSRGAQSFGPGLGNRSFSRSSATGSVSVGATIIDHAEMDRALLAEAARRRGATHDVLGRPVTSGKSATPDATRQVLKSAKPRWQALWKAKN